MKIRNNFFSAMTKFILMNSICIFMGCKSEVKVSLHAANLVDEVQPNRYLRGVNIMDMAMGYGAGSVPGTYNTHYTKPTLAGLQYLRSRGHDVVRVPFLWERVQPVLDGPLNTAYLGYIIEALENANLAGLKVILDMHNGAGYFNGTKTTRFGFVDGPTSAQYSDVWRKLSLAIKANPFAHSALYAYDIMNEPHSIRDTRGILPDTGNLDLTNFSSTDDGWGMAYNSGGETRSAAQDTYNGGSLKVVYTYPAGTYSYKNIGISRTGIVGGINPANGKTLRITGYLPAGIQGDFPQIRLTLRQGSFTQLLIGSVPINKGQEFDVVFTPSDTNWVNITGLEIALVLNNVTGVGNYEYYLTKVQQGTSIVGMSGAKTWEIYSQDCVDAIRGNDDNATVMIEGYNFASTSEWPTRHPSKWIVDPLDKIIYQGHTYFDTDVSGTYTLTFAQETTNAINAGYTSVADRAVKRVKPFTDWVKAEGVKGFIGELGWPNSVVVPTDAANWNLVGEEVFKHLDEENMGATMWCTGRWMMPAGNILNAYSMSPFSELSPSIILENHLGKEYE